MHTMTRKYQEYMQQAIELAKRSTMEMKHGCVIVNNKYGCNSSVVATGINQHLFNQEERNVFSIHSEQMALSSLLALRSHNRSFMNNCIAFVARVGAPSQGYPVRMSKPCYKCQQLLFKLGVKKVFYTIDDRHMVQLTQWDL